MQVIETIKTWIRMHSRSARRRLRVASGNCEWLESKELLTVDLAWSETAQNDLFIRNVYYESVNSSLISALSVKVDYENLGTTTLNADFKYEYFASSDAVFGNADDLLLGEGEDDDWSVWGRGLDPNYSNGPQTGIAAPAGGIDRTVTPYLFCVLDPENAILETNEANNVLRVLIPNGPRIQWTGGEELHVNPGQSIRLAPEAVFVPGSVETTTDLWVVLRYRHVTAEQHPFIASEGGISQKGRSIKWGKKKIGKFVGGTGSLVYVDFKKDVPASVVQQVIRNFSMSIVPSSSPFSEAIDFFASDEHGLIGFDSIADKQLIVGNPI